MTNVHNFSEYLFSIWNVHTHVHTLKTEVQIQKKQKNDKIFSFFHRHKISVNKKKTILWLNVIKKIICKKSM